MKTIFIALYSGRDVRDILRTNILKILKANKLRIIILSAAYNDKDFISEFADENVIIERLYLSKGKLESLFLLLLNSLIMNANFSNTNRIKLDRDRWLRKTCRDRQTASNKKGLLFHLKSFSSNFNFHKSIWFRKLLDQLFISLFPDKHYQELFTKYKPDLVFVSHSFTGPEIAVLKRAIKNHVPTIAIIPSWDNLTTKGIIPVKIDKLIVWNEIMKREAVELHNYSPGDIYVCGIPQYDMLNNKELISQEQFFKENDLDMNKKLITYAMGNDSYFPEEHQMIEIINDAITKREITPPAQVLVRRYTKNIDHQKLKIIENLRNVTLQRADHQSQLLPGAWSQKKKDLIMLGATMKYSDIVLNFASTITIDGALFDTPIINIGFDGYKKKNYSDSVRRYHDYDHYHNIVKTRGVRIAENRKELIEFINNYLKDRTLDMDGRTKIVRQQCYKLDNRSGNRVAEAVLELLSF